MVEALRRPASPGPLDVNFIYPTMHLTESSGLAAEVLTDVYKRQISTYYAALSWRLADTPTPNSELTALH